jgi:anthranilate/para-aminobenzoate synthase component II
MPLKTLLIDNYDSYTYNLFQLIAEVNGGVSNMAKQRRHARLQTSSSKPASGPGCLRKLHDSNQLVINEGG